MLAWLYLPALLPALLLALLVATAMQAAHAQAAPTPAPVLVLHADTRPVNLDPSLEFLLDTNGRFTVEQLDNQPGLPFAPVVHGQRHLIENGSLWLRFDAASQKPDAHWRLTVPLPGVDDVSLYYRDAAGQWVTQQAGDTRAMSQWAQPGRYPIFSLSPEAGKPVRYYVQIRHPRVPYSALPRIVSDVQLINASQAEHLVLGIYFGLAALVITLALANALTYRDAGFGTYALYIATFAASQASFTGVAGLYWWPEWSNSSMATVLLLPSAAASAMWFVRTVTLPRRFTRTLDLAMLALMILLPLGGLVDAVAPTPTSYLVMNSLIGLSMAVLFTVVGVALVAGDYHTRWVAAGFLPVLLSAAFPLLRNLSVIPSSFLSDYALLLGSAIEVPILFYGLHRRVSQRRNLTARASGLDSHDALTGLHSARVFLAKLRHALSTAERHQLPFGMLLVNLSNLASLQKTHGQETADRAVVMAAARIGAAARSSDTVARIGDAQFALLMEGPTSAEAANGMATKILASGLRHSNQLPDAEPLQFHIAVGHLGGRASAAQPEADSCLAHMVQAVTGMDHGSRKTIRLVKF